MYLQNYMDSILVEFSETAYFIIIRIYLFIYWCVIMLYTGYHYRCAERRHSGVVGDVVPAQVCAKSQRRSALFRPGRQLRTWSGLVQEADAVLVPQPNHHWKEPQLFRDTGGKKRKKNWSKILINEATVNSGYNGITLLQ